MENIEKILLPESNKLVKIQFNSCEDDEYFYSAKILDEELDIIDCSFYGDGTVEIDTKGYNNLVLSIENLKTLIKLLKQADKKFEC